MSIKLELDAESIKQAITTHISNQGFDLTNKSVEVSLVNGRGGNGNRAVVVISDDTAASAIHTNNLLRTAAVTMCSDQDFTKSTLKSVKPKVENIDEVPETQIEEIPATTSDAIIASANLADPFGQPDLDMNDGSLFPELNPSMVAHPKSLF